MLIYVEGPAGAGKTSFIQSTKVRCTDFAIFDEYFYDEDTSTTKGLATFIKNTEAKMRSLKNLNSDEVTLVDRGYLSMLVNAFVEQQHGLNQTYDEALDWLNKNQKDCLKPDVYVYITAPKELIHSRAKDGGWYREDLGWIVDPDLAMEKYEDLFKDHADGIPILRLDGRKNSNELVDELLAFLG